MTSEKRPEFNWLSELCSQGPSSLVGNDVVRYPSSGYAVPVKYLYGNRIGPTEFMCVEVNPVESFSMMLVTNARSFPNNAL